MWDVNNEERKNWKVFVEVEVMKEVDKKGYTYFRHC